MPYFDDDGNQLNPDLIPIPSLCIGCRKYGIEDGDEEILCNLNRLDYSADKEFVCYAFEPK
jgi:hypothetical protein